MKAGSGVLVIGDAMLDRYWFGTAERMSPEAPVPVLDVATVEDRPGGAANVAANIAALGGAVSLAAIVGHDEAGMRLRELLRHDVSFEWLELAGVRTSMKIRHVTSHQHLLRTDFESRPHPEQVAVFTRMVLPMLREHPVVVLSDYGKGALGQCARIIAAASEHGCRVLVDPKGADWERYRGAWLLKPNEAELRAVVGPWSDEAHFVARASGFRDGFGLEHLLVTRGERGMSLFSAGAVNHFPAEARAVFDVCGAGDTVIATMAHLVARGTALLDAIPIANRAAGIVVGKFGTAAVTAAELEGAA